MKNIGYILFLIFGLYGCEAQKEIQIVQAPTSITPKPPYSAGVWADDFLFLAGQLGTVKDGKIIDATFTDEVHAVMKNLQKVLNNAGLTFENVVKTTVYLTDVNDFDAMNAAYRTYFPNEKFPARETVGVAQLLRGAKIEISMIAYKHK
jgi:2-iminobutanoate/2-iminopropanoate deaminase